MIPFRKVLFGQNKNQQKNKNPKHFSRFFSFGHFPSSLFPLFRGLGAMKVSSAAVVRVGEDLEPRQRKT